jgi:antitoxin component YwqK of YwqJK toxin-antitoxin module
VLGVAGGCLACAALFGPRVEGTCRNGRTDGPYTLELDHVVVEGHFSNGARSGLFRFRTESGALLAEIPYVADLRDGVLRVWYHPDSAAAGTDRRRLEAELERGERDGATRYWYEDGRPRAEYMYVEGALVGARGWNDAGEALSADEAEAQARVDRTSDEQYLTTLEEAVRKNPPRCAR